MDLNPLKNFSVTHEGRERTSISSKPKFKHPADMDCLAYTVVQESTIFKWTLVRGLLIDHYIIL